MSENYNPNSSNSGDQVDAAVATMVARYTDSAPQAPDVNAILTERATRPSRQASNDQRWLRPALLGVFALLVLAGGAAVARGVSGSGGGQVIADPAETTDDESNPEGSDDGQAPNDGETGDQTGDQAGDPASDQDPSNDETPQADLGALAGAEAAGDLPDAAPTSYWAVAGDAADLVQVQARTGEIVANVGGWGLQELGEGDVGQALQQPEVAADGTVYVDDCCEPASGSVFRLLPGDRFDPDGPSWQTGLYPSASPSGDLIAIGTSLRIVTGAGTEVASIGDPGDDVEGQQVIPLAWVDEQTIAVRMFGSIEEIRIYEIEGDLLVERVEARRVAPKRFHMDGDVRADGMLVVATRRPNGNPLGLAGGGDVVGEVIDPNNGELVTEFDLPDMVNNIDYDGSGRFLLTSGDDGVVRWFGLGQSGVLAESVISASWD